MAGLFLDDEGNVSISVFRQPQHILFLYCTAYGLVFVVGLVGNSFVVAAVVLYPGMRNITNFFITSLAIADLLIIVFCLPATLMNAILTEWLLGNVLCKISVWINGTTSCSSVYTLVAVTGDRYVAICHTMRYNVIRKSRALWIILPVWLASGLLFAPWLFYFQEIAYPVANTSIVARICYPVFPSMHAERMLFLIVNFLIAFLIPLIAITVCYTFIFATIFRHESLAVDAKAQERETRIKMRVTNMMLTVIILFAASWLPLYCLFTFIYFGEPALDSASGQLVGNILRPVFQWLSLANSSINPLLYAYFSNKFRRAFQEILVLPCRRRYARVRNYARNTMKRYSSKSVSERPERTGGTSGDPEQTRLLSLSVPNRSLIGTHSFNAKLSPRGGGNGTTRRLRSEALAVGNGRAGSATRVHVQPPAPNSLSPPSADPSSDKPSPLRYRRSIASVTQGGGVARVEVLSRASPSRSFSPAGSSLDASPLRLPPRTSLHTAPASPPESGTAESGTERPTQEETLLTSDADETSSSILARGFDEPGPFPAPLLTMRDLDLSSFNSGRDSALDSSSSTGQRSANASADSCALRFVQIRDTTVV